MMKHFDVDHVAEVARRFAASAVAESWPMFGEPIRSALLDSVVMTELRIARSYATTMYSAAEICAFRCALEHRLSEGVRPTKGKEMRFYKVECES